MAGGLLVVGGIFAGGRCCFGCGRRPLMGVLLCDYDSSGIFYDSVTPFFEICCDQSLLKCSRNIQNR